MLLSATVPLFSGLTALSLLVGLQGVVAFALSRSHRVELLVKAEPTLLYRSGCQPRR